MTLRPSPGKGGVDRLRSGRFRARLVGPDGRRVMLGAFSTQGEAERVLAEARHQVAQGELTPASGVSLHAWGDRWLDQREKNGYRGMKAERQRWNQYIVTAPFYERPLRSIARREIREWLNASVRPGHAQQTVLNVLNLLRSCLEGAVQDERLQVNPARDIRLPRESQTSDKWTYLSVDEQSALLGALREPDRSIVAFAMGTGLRAGELVTLRTADVEVTGDTPQIVVRYGKTPDQPTKGNRLRNVPLFGLALDVAKEWLRSLPRYAKFNPHGLMFPRKGGSFRDEAHVITWAAWKGVPEKKVTTKRGVTKVVPRVVGALERAGISRNVRWHDLRHTCASSLVSGLWGRPWSLEEVKAMLDHRNISTTERYAHFASSALKRAAAETDRAMVTRREFEAQAPVISIVSEEFVNRRSRVQFPRMAPTVPRSCAERDEARSLRANASAATKVSIVSATAPTLQGPRRCTAGPQTDPLPNGFDQRVLPVCAQNRACLW